MQHVCYSRSDMADTPVTNRRCSNAGHSVPLQIFFFVPAAMQVQLFQNLTTLSIRGHSLRRARLQPTTNTKLKSLE